MWLTTWETNKSGNLKKMRNNVNVPKFWKRCKQRKCSLNKETVGEIW